MRKNLIRKAVVLVICLAFLGITSSTAFAAKPNLRQTLMKPYTFLVSLLPALGDLFGKSKAGNGQGDQTSTGVVRPTGDGGPKPQPPKD
jgi:hypothetical protein